jgi:hypothetical protein
MCWTEAFWDYLKLLLVLARCYKNDVDGKKLSVNGKRSRKLHVSLT